MAGLFSNIVSINEEIEHCARREAEERRLAAAAKDITARDAHLGLAERYADRAWSLSERGDSAPVPSGLWKAYRH
ncbi:hypothetical protein [Sphingomonas oryzagri]